MNAMIPAATLALVQAQPAAARTALAPAAMAELSRHLIGALMQGIERIAELNVATTRALLARPGSGSREQFDRVVDSWRFSWRTYEICATTAASVLQLMQGQARAGFDELWNALEQGLAALPHMEPERARELRCAFESMRAAYSDYFDATVNTHRCLLTLATGAR